MAVLKKEKKAAALKKYLLRKCNCCVEIVTLNEKIASPKIKLSSKCCNTCEKGNRYLKKKTKNRLVITLNRNYFPERFPHPGKYSYETTHEYWLEPTEEEIIRLSLCHTTFINFYSCMYHNLKKCLNRRSRHQRCSIEKAVLKNFLIFTGNQLRWSLFLIELQTQA